MCGADMYMENVTADFNHKNGIALEVSSISMTLVSSNHNHNSGIVIIDSIETIIMNSSFTSNNGSGIQLDSASNTKIMHMSSKYNGKYGVIDTYSMSTTITDSHLFHNEGGDITLIRTTDFSIVRTVATIVAHISNRVHLKDTIFSGMSSSSTFSSTVDPTSLPAIVELYNSNATVYNCSFIKNTISVIKAIGSGVTFSGELTFSHNSAPTGTVLIFARSSTLIITENCKVFFIDNHASNFGGVIYISTEESYVRSMTLDNFEVTQDYGRINSIGSLTVSRTECFIHVLGSRYDTRLVFVNNTAGKGGDVLYGGLVALGWDGDWNCLLSFKSISDMLQQNSLSAITSNPSRVCFCKDAEPDCLTVADPITHHVYPGQTITIPAVVVGQDFGTVTGFVYAKFLKTPFTIEMAPGQNVTSIDQSQCSSIEYTVFSENEESKAILVLAANNMDISYTLDESDNQEFLDYSQ